MGLNKLACALALILVGSAANAAPPKGSYLDEMARIDAEMSLFRKQMEFSNLRQGASPQEATKDRPKVVSVYGQDKRLVAELRYMNGLVVSVSVGDEIPGGYRIYSMGKTGVTVTDGNKKKFGLEYHVGVDVVPDAPPMAMPVAPYAGPYGEVAPRLPILGVPSGPMTGSPGARP